MNRIISFFRTSQDVVEQSLDSRLTPYLDQLYRSAYQYTGCQADAEDLLHDLLIETYAKQSALHKIDNLSAWLNRCLYHRFVDGYRKKRRQPVMENIDDSVVSQQLASRNSSQEEHYYHHQVLESLELLPSDQRAAVTLFDISGHSLKELADIMDMPEGTIKSLLHRGRKKLKNHLQLQPFEDKQRHELQRKTL